MSRFATLRRYRLFGLLFALCLSAVLLFAPQATSAPPPATPPPDKKIDVTKLSLTDNVRKTVLDNGLTVLTKEVHTSPVVSVQVWYKVGSRNEAPGVNGIAHQLEHMMFKGTTDRPIQFGRLFSALGSDSNAFTSYDQTAYFGTVEREKLKALLVLEADRMQNSRIDAEKLASEKRVVISELQGYENSPNYRLSRAVMRAVFPNTPYGLPVGGTKADVEKFTVEQVREYYRKYYSPDNATLVIVGDFQTEPTLSAVKEIFGKLLKSSSPRPEGSDRPENAPVSPSSPLSTQNSALKTPIVLRQEGSTALLQVVYPLPSVNHPDVPALSVMDYILTGGRSSRLYQALVESGKASSISGSPANLMEGGWYELSATAAPGQEVAKIDTSLAGAIADLRDRGVTEEELKRAKTQLLAAVILQNRDITSGATQLGYDQITAGDYRYTDRFLAAVQKVSAQDVQRVAQTYLADALRTVGYFEPTKVAGQPTEAGKAPTQTSETFNAGPPVDPAEVAKYLPQVDTSGVRTQSLPEQFTLANGLRVLLLRDKSTPTVTLRGFIRAGTEFDQTTSAGLASLTAENLMNGTKTRDALTQAKVLEDQGISLNFAAYREGVDIEGNSLSAQLPTIIQTFADVVQNATFPNNELELSRQRAVSAVKLQLDNPSSVAQRAFQQTVYPENHPFHAFPTEESLKRITRDDVVRFYQENYRPDNTILTLVGDFDPVQVRRLLETQLLSWKASGKPQAPSYPQVSLPQKVVRLSKVLPGKAQSVTFLGYKGIDRQDPRYYAATVLNQILGGDTLSSRLGTEIRDRQGLTYGIYSYFQAGRYAGPFLIQMQTAPEDATKAIASTISLLVQVGKQGVTASEVRTAQRSLNSGYNVSLANPDSLASRILMNEVYGLPTGELRDFTSKIQAVTPSDVSKAASELLHPDNLVVVTAGPSVSAASGR